MNKMILTAAAVAGLGISTYAQGILFEDNSGASFDTKIYGTPNTTQDLNLELLLGTTSGNLNVDVVTLLLSAGNTTSGTALGQTITAAGDISAAGYIYDNSGTAYDLSAYAGQQIYLQVDAWLGNYSSYAAALAANFFQVGQSGVFSATVGATPTSFPIDISGVGVINFETPEPTTIALAGLGGLSLLFLRRKK